ncbi:MAG: response regulator [Planctomycetes bacterium]|nr:response regulator [Planctomycetota bacterium]
MFLLKSIDLVALIGLLVQTLVAWIFVAIFASMGRRERVSKAFGHFHLAFVALAASLTVMSVRFSRAHDVQDAAGLWQDGSWLPTACYCAYLALKTLFGLWLVRGGAALAGSVESLWLRRGGWVLVAVMAVIPLAVTDISPLLLIQAPVMVACALAAWRELARSPNDGAGLRVMRWSLLGLATSWTLHAIAASFHGAVPWLRVLLALNSFIDLAVQLTLGTGLIIGLLEEAQRRARVAEVEHTRLQRELDRDEKLRALGTLVSGVAHELNNPLTVILGYADLLRRAPTGGPAARIIGEQAERCRGIVQSLSALAGQTAHSPQDLDVAELVERVTQGFALAKSADGPSLRVVSNPGLRMAADRTGMEQVLTNLIANAVHASPRGGVVTIAATSSAAGVELSVADQGPGVPRELRTRVFEPFFTTKGPGRGTGLGLAIAHAIVRGHDGTIAIDDGPDGRGAVFRVTIPRASPVAAAPFVEKTEREGSRRLLVIDDDEAVRAVVRDQAERRGWLVAEVASAESALEALGIRDAFDAVLCDLRMPGMGGIGLHDRLQREAPELLDRVVFVTGDLASEESTRFSRRCRRKLVQKPLDFDELFTALARRDFATAR